MRSRSPLQTLTPQPLVLWRISSYASLDGIGAFRSGGRWNSPGRHVVYLSENTAGSMLETLVHLSPNATDLPDSFRLLRIELPRAVEIFELTFKPKTAPADLAACRQQGDAWLQSGATAIARVPSVVAPFAWNYLLNPAHPQAKQATIAGLSEHLYDPRLLRIR